MSELDTKTVEAAGAKSNQALPEVQVVRLESIGKGAYTAEVDAKLDFVTIRRGSRLIQRFKNEDEITDFAEQKKLSAADQDSLYKLETIADAKRRRLTADIAGVLAEAAENKAKETFGMSPSWAANASPQSENSIAIDSEKGRLRTELQRNDAEVFAWVEKQRKARLERVEPIEAAVMAAAAAKAAEAKSSDTIEREGPFASPNFRIKAVPPEIGAQFTQVGDKFYHPNNTKAVAFVDRGDKLETPSSTPQMAQSLVKIAEARGWDELRVKGTDGFRREVWLEASVRGIHVDGYKPSELDKVELEKRSTFMQNRNSVEVRSEAFRKMSPQEGVRHDPSLAAAYGTEAAAKRFAERIDPESRAAFVHSVKEAVTHRLESGEPVVIKLKVPEGQLIEHGSANYKFDKDEKASYYVKLAESNGRERTYWGAGLRQAMSSIDAQPGDSVQLKVTESKGVVVEGNVRNESGHVVGRETVNSHRNEWEATVIAKARAQTLETPERERDRDRVRVR